MSKKNSDRQTFAIDKKLAESVKKQASKESGVDLSFRQAIEIACKKFMDAKNDNSD